MREQITSGAGRARRQWRAGLIAVVALVIAALVTPLAFAAPGAQDGPTVLRIGYLGDPTGDAGNGARLAIDQINGAGGFAAQDGTTYLFELITLPDAATEGSLSSDVNKLMQREGLIALLGPDDNEVLSPDNVDALVETDLPILTPATADRLTEDDDTNSLFRIRAPEYAYNWAMVSVLVEEIAAESFALVQTDVASTAALASFEDALSDRGITPIDKIQQPDNARLDDHAETLASRQPDVVAMWGPMADAASLLRQLRDDGWEGRFVYRHADEAARAQAFPRELAEGILGMNNWVYTYGSRASQIFLRDYSVAFNKLPSGVAVAGYDAIWYLRSTVINFGASPENIRDGLMNGNPVALVHGPFHPVDYSNGDLTRVSTVYALDQYGGPVVLARFDEREPLVLDETGDAVVDVPTPTPGPPTITPLPSATLEGVWATVTATALNVRGGPGFDYDRILQLSEGDAVRVLGTNVDYTWLSVQLPNGGLGWINTQYVEISGDLTTIQFVPVPPTPTQAATAAPSEPDLVIENVVLSPAQPVPNQPFSATVTVRNLGGAAAGQFAVAATFQPGGVYSSAFVNSLAPGETAQAQLTANLPGTGVAQVAVIADLNNTVAEYNEDNNQYNITYRADYPPLNEQSNVQLSSGQELDLFSSGNGVADIRWDGSGLSVINGAQIGLLGGVAYQDVHYDQLSPSVINNPTGLDGSQVNAGAVMGVFTTEGRRAVLRIDNRAGDQIFVSYRVYNAP